MVIDYRNTLLKLLLNLEGVGISRGSRIDCGRGGGATRGPGGSLKVGRTLG